MLGIGDCWVDVEGGFVIAAGLDATDALLSLLLGPEVEDGLQSVSWHLLLSSTLLPKLTNADLSEVQLFLSLLIFTFGCPGLWLEPLGGPFWVRFQQNHENGTRARQEHCAAEHMTHRLVRVACCDEKAKLVGMYRPLMLPLLQSISMLQECRLDVCACKVWLLFVCCNRGS